MAFESIHNYYEQLVFKHIYDTLVDQERETDGDFLEDVACVALNQLPARYVRHDVDLAFYMSGDERQEVEQSVAAAVRDAAKVVRAHRGHPAGTAPRAQRGRARRR